LHQRRLEDLIHMLQFELLKEKLKTWHDAGGQDLLEGMWLVSTYQYPDIDLTTLRQDVEQIYYEAWMEFRKEIHPFDQVKILNNVIFSKLGFRANTKNFHSPGNSMINVVLETKKGNPISLCVVYLLIAQKLELPIYGVNLPNLFICTYKTHNLQFYINAFNKGLIFSRSDIDNYIQQLHLNAADMYFEPCQNVEIVRRVLRNLIISFEKVGDHYKSDEIKQLIRHIGADEGDRNVT
jgi:regulator of sirC expression with transglutaminase-like and TPR domain